MSLSDAMSASGLSVFAEAGFVISFLLFLLVLGWVLLRPKAEMNSRARAILDDEPRVDEGPHQGDMGHVRR